MTISLIYDYEPLALDYNAGHRLTCGGCTFHLVPLRYYDFFVVRTGVEPVCEPS